MFKAINLVTKDDDLLLLRNSFIRYLNTSDKVLILYHKDCNDGIGALYAALYGSKPYEGMQFGIEHLAIQYGDSPPDVTDKVVLILDFSFPPEVLVEMQKVAKYILVLDHHKGSIEDYADKEVWFLPEKTQIIFNIDNSMSGATMTWCYFNSTYNTAPELLKCIEDRDLWIKKHPLVEEVNLFVRKYNTVEQFKEWDKVIGNEGTNFVDAMRPFTEVKEYYQNLCKNIANNVSEKDYHLIDGYEVPFVNCPSFTSSDVGHLLGDKHYFVVLYSIVGESVLISFRSRQDGGADVNAISKKYGGGGHQHAAGLRMSLNNFFTTFLRTKE